MPLAVAAAPAGPSCLLKEAAGNLGSSLLRFHQWDHADPELSYAFAGFLSQWHRSWNSWLFQCWKCFLKYLNERWAGAQRAHVPLILLKQLFHNCQRLQGSAGNEPGQHFPVLQGATHLYLRSIQQHLIYLALILWLLLELNGRPGSQAYQGYLPLAAPCNSQLVGAFLFIAC